MLEVFVRSSIRDFYGPLIWETPFDRLTAVIQKFHDTPLISGYGRVSVPIPGKAKVSQALFAHLARSAERKESWSEFFRSPLAMSFRKECSKLPNLVKGQSLTLQMNTWAETFERHGLPTAFLSQETEEWGAPPIVEYFPDGKVTPCSVYGASVPDVQRIQGARRFAVDFTFSYASDQVLPRLVYSLKSDPLQRPLSLIEAVTLSGVDSQVFSDGVVHGLWMSLFCKHWFQKKSLDLRQITMGFAIDAQDQIKCADGFSLEEMKIFQGVRPLLDIENGDGLSREALDQWRHERAELIKKNDWDLRKWSRPAIGTVSEIQQKTWIEEVEYLCLMVFDKDLSADNSSVIPSPAGNA